MTGPEIIEWAVKLCQKEKIPPTDSAIVRMIRYHQTHCGATSRVRERDNVSESVTVTVNPFSEIKLPGTIQFQRIGLVIAKWKAERDAKCESCKKGLALGRHGCHFEDIDEESYTVGNCKAWPLSRRIQQLDEAMQP